MQLVKLTLKKLWTKVSVRRLTDYPEEPTINASLNSSDDLFQQYLSTQEPDTVEINSIAGTFTSAKDNEPNYRISGHQLLISLEEFEKAPRPDFKLTSSEIWKDRKETFPNLYVLARIINTIPPSQASAERCFSAFSLTYNSSRYNLSQDLLEDILCIKLNQTMLHDIFNKHRAELQSENSSEYESN